MCAGRMPFGDITIVNILAVNLEFDQGFPVTS
jgi:hypothetical protein